MASSRTIKGEHAGRFTPGTQMYVYLESQCKYREGLAPVGSPVAGPIALGADYGAAFTGLPDDTPVGLYGLVGGQHRYLLFRT